LKQNQFWGSCWASPLWNSSGRGAEIMDVVVSVPQQDWLWQMKMISTWDFPAEPTGFGYLMTKRYQDWLWLHMWTNILMDKTAVLWTSYGLFFSEVNAPYPNFRSLNPIRITISLNYLPMVCWNITI
jgi:hypothetical protein